MQHRLISLLFVLCVGFGLGHALTPEQLIPAPSQIIKGSGEVRLAKGFTVATSSKSKEIKAELTKFVADINASTGLKAKVARSKGFIFVAIDPGVAPEGYTLTITPKGVTITASDAAGVFYAFQTIKRLLPANVMARQFKKGPYTLPVVTIADRPRFEYRGFMLDVSRHFFDAAEVKKMLDLMATYKLNRFHWHLTDDQGWRLPISKYPLLTTKGATNKNILLTDFTKGKQWRAGANEVYGPYAYTTEEVRDIVAYAKARHIEIIPEIDMPGHMVAAIHCYPELSTDPESKLVDKATENSRYNDFSHDIWNKGGVSWDCLDVSNEKVYQFVNDVIDEVVELFPYEYIHIGGDETDLIAWENSPACTAKLAELGKTNYRALQSYFTKRVADYAKSKGRKVMAWNEIVSHGGTDMDMIRDIDPTIFCWIGGEDISEANGLKHVYTGFNGGYYINRSYRGFDRVGAAGDGSLATTLKINPPLNQHCIGVQGTFWTEQVDTPRDMEYLALPRLMGIAEQGWSTTINKDLDEFISRLNADREYLDLAGYSYGAHQLVSPDNKKVAAAGPKQKPKANVWYYIKSNCIDSDRTDRVWCLDDNGLLMGKRHDRTNPAQLFRFVEDPSNPGHYAIVCKANPTGHLASTPTATTTAGRWTYAPDGALDYGFTLNGNYYGTVGSDFYYAIMPSAAPYYMNFAKNGQSFAINVYSDPDSGNGGHMLFIPAE